MALNTSICTFSHKISKHLIKLKDVKVRHRSFNSHDWLKRREVDRYVELAKKKNYRCRSAFKLIEIDNKFKLLQPGFKVLDVGAAPGSWSQVLAERTNARGEDPNSPVGLVVAVDISAFQSIEGVITLPNTDFTKESSQNKILEVLNGDKFDFIFSDMAPPSVGVKECDQDRILQLIYPVILFSVKNLRIGGGCLIKIWDGRGNAKLKSEMERFFRLFRFVKPNASYKSSAENYLLGKDFLGLENE